MHPRNELTITPAELLRLALLRLAARRGVPVAVRVPAVEQGRLFEGTENNLR